MPNNGSVSPQPSTFIDLLEWRKNRSSRRPPSVTSETLETTESPPAITEPQRTAEPVPSTQYPETPFGTRPTYHQGVVIVHNKPREPLWYQCPNCSPEGCVLCFPCWCLYCLYESTRPPQPPPTAEIVPLTPNLAQIRH